MKRKFTKEPTNISAGVEIRTYRNNRNPNKYIEVKKGNDGHSYARQYLKWETPQGEVKNYMGARTSRGRYFRHRQDSIAQMLEDYTEVTASSEVEIDVDAFEEMIDEEDFYKLLHFGKDTVEEYYEECDYIESIYGGDCGVESVQQVSQSSYQVEVSVELEVDYDDGDSGFESGTVILSYDMNTHEVDLVDASGIGE